MTKFQNVRLHVSDYLRVNMLVGVLDGSKCFNKFMTSLVQPNANEHLIVKL